MVPLRARKVGWRRRVSSTGKRRLRVSMSHQESESEIWKGSKMFVPLGIRSFGRRDIRIAHENVYGAELFLGLLFIASGSWGSFCYKLFEVR